MTKVLGIARNKPINLIGLIVVAASVLGLQFVFPDAHVYQIQAPRFLNLWMDQIVVSNWVFVFGAIPFVFLNLLLVFHINSRFNIIGDAYYLPAWLYFMICLNDFRLFHLSAELIGSFFFLLGVYIFLAINHVRKPYPRLFWTGFMFAVSSLFHPQVLAFVPLIWIGMIVFNQMKARNFINLIVGMLVVYFLNFSSFYIFDQLPLWHQYFEWDGVFAGVSIPGFTELLLDFLLMVMSVVSLFYLSVNSGYMKVLRRKCMYFFALMFLFCLGTYVFDGFNVYLRFYIALPLTMLFSNYLTRTKSRIMPRTLMWFFFMFFVISQALSVFASLS